jgi:ATP-dependent DNA helicase PIF1
VEIGVGDNKRTVLVPEFKTEIFEYQVSKDDYNKPKVESKSVASYTCLGLKNASASTLHKTQGLTLSKGYIYLENWIPENGLYVALSRFRNMNDFGLKRPIKKSDIRVNKEALDFVNNLKKTE